MTSRAASPERHAPKLPARSPEEIEAAFVAANAAVTSKDPSETSPRPPTVYENPVVFEAPELLPLRAIGVAWTAARVAIFVWTSAIAFVAIRTTQRIDRTDSDQSIAAAGDDMARVVVVGVLLLASLLAISVLWSRRVAENTRRLRGRWPSLNRATRVWFYPMVWVAVAALTFLRVEVNEFDPLPAIAATGFAIALYCPYSMIQRTFKTLTRLRPDGEIRAAYLVDLAGFGIIWWRLTDWPDPTTTADSGTVDAMAWAGITSSGLLLISAGITAHLVHQTIAAQRYRIRVLATRHVQGLALPLVPRKAWGRVRTSIDDAAAHGAGPVGDVVRAADLVVGPGGVPSAAVAAARRTVVPARGAVAESDTSTDTGDRNAPRRTTEAGDAAVGPPRVAARAGEAPVARRRPVPGAAGRVAARRRPGHARDGTELAARRRPGAAPARGGGPPNRRAAADAVVTARRLPAAGQARVGRAAMPGAAGAAVARRRAASGATPDVAQRRALAPTGRRPALPAISPPDDVRTSGGGDTPRSGVGDAPRSRGGEVPSSRVERGGPRVDRPTTSPVGRQDPRHEVRTDARVDDDVDVDEPPEPATLLEVLRFASLGAHLALAATFVWFVVESRRATASSGGVLDLTSLDRLDLVRTANVVTFAVTVLLIGAWGAMTSLLGRQSDRSAPSPWLVAAMCVPATLLALAGLVIDARVGEGIVFTLVVVAGAFGGACSLVLLSTMSTGVADNSHGMRIWAAVIGVVGLGLTIGGYLQPIEPDESLSTLTLVAVLTSILVGLGALLGALASHELDDIAGGKPAVDAGLSGEEAL